MFTTYVNGLTIKIPNGYGLSGTPLNETLVSLHQIIPQFQKNHDLQKVQCVILTDGEANHLPYCKTWISMRDGEEREGTSNLVRGHSYLRNRKTGHTYKVGDYFYQFTELLLTDLKESFPYTNFIGIRLADPVTSTRWSVVTLVKIPLNQSGRTSSSH